MVMPIQKPNLADSIPYNLDHLQVRRPLQLLMSYRLLLATILALLFFTHSAPTIFGSQNPQLFTFVSPIYVGLVLISGVFIDHAPRLSGKHQVFLMVFVDIFALTLLMHASGGVKTGLGMLIGVSIVAGSLIIQGRWGGAAIGHCRPGHSCRASLFASDPQPDTHKLHPGGSAGRLVFCHRATLHRLLPTDAKK